MMIHVARTLQSNTNLTVSAPLCSATGLGLALVDPRWASRATCRACLEILDAQRPCPICEQLKLGRPAVEQHSLGCPKR
jgi:hypothetical protein